MLLYPSDIFEKLEFDKILQLAEEQCQGIGGKEYFRDLSISTDKTEVELLLDETNEWKTSIEEGELIPSGLYSDIHGDLLLLNKEGYVLDIESILRIKNILIIAYEIQKYFKDYQKQDKYSKIAKIALNIDIDVKIINELNRIFDETGEIKPDASDALVKISRSISNKERELLKVFKKELIFYQEKGFLVENMESVRNGRLVLTSSTEAKRKIPGIIHDESGTGKTVYIEPAQTVQINNELINLHTERRTEIYRIVRDLCKYMMPYSGMFSICQEVIVKLDTIRAKARLSQVIGGIRPQVIGKPRFCFIGAYSPLLFLRLMESDELVVPFTLELLKENRLLILSGPNAGGKSVTMKTVGLLQLMLQAGFLVTCDENSKFGIFKSFFVDIGDQQSIEDDLSTYSSHLTNMKKVVEFADKNSMVLIDEFGAGTDPKIGGAIAESILKEINEKKAFGVITTHYSNLKFYAFKAKGIVNASMEFDREELSPSYQLVVGKPGSSFAYEIATKIGMPDHIVDYAKFKSGKNAKAIEEMLVDLQGERQEFEAKMTKVMEKEDRLNRLIGTYDQMHLDLEAQRKKIKLDRKEAELYSAAEATREVQKLVSELKKNKDLEKAEALIKEKKSQRSKIAQQVGSLKDEVVETARIDLSKVVVGSHVKMRNSSTVGKVLAVKNKKVDVEMGFLTMTVNLNELIPVNAPAESQNKGVNISKVTSIGNFDTKADIRGYVISDARMFVREFIERGMLNNVRELRIVHGVGSGALRKETHKVIREYRDIKEYYHPEKRLGGEGVTMVLL